MHDEDMDYLIQRSEAPLQDGDVQQGRIFWLPSKEGISRMASKEKLSNEGLWRREVRRGHSTGAIDEGIYSHPVVVVSRPKKDSRYVHFLLITSFNGKRLDQVYSKSKDFHAGRRTWYLPVAPTADHPDALSKKTKRRFPTLTLANGAVLRKNSYVDIRNVYKIDWTLLREYTNPDTPETYSYRFERESCIKMLAKCRTLVEYEPGEQRFSPASRSGSQQSEEESENEGEEFSQRSSIILPERCASPEPLGQSDFCEVRIEVDPLACPLPKAPPDGEGKLLAQEGCIAAHYNKTVAHYLERVPKFFQMSIATQSLNQPKGFPHVDEIRDHMDRAWRDAKGVTAILIASI